MKSEDFNEVDLVQAMNPQPTQPTTMNPQNVTMDPMAELSR